MRFVNDVEVRIDGRDVIDNMLFHAMINVVVGCCYCWSCHCIVMLLSMMTVMIMMSINSDYHNEYRVVR